MNNPKIKYRVNTLRQIAIEYSERALEDSEIEQKDITPVYYRELDLMLDNNETIKIGLIGQVREGKSTVGMEQGEHIFEGLRRRGRRGIKERFGMKNIARDQQEFAETAKDPSINNTVIVIDEINEMSNTGLNSTTETALLETISDIHAGRYIHSVSCSPEKVADKNCEIILHIRTKDKENKITICNVYYKVRRPGQEFYQIIGHVKISVEKLIREWIKQRPELGVKRKYKLNGQVIKEFNSLEDVISIMRNEAQQRTLDKIAKEDFYTEYMKKKYEKMDMLTKEGIARTRDLNYAPIILAVQAELAELTELGIIDKEIIQGLVEDEARQQGIIELSMLGIKEITNKCYGILKLYKTINRLMQKGAMIREAYARGKLLKEAYKIKMKTLDNSIKKVENVLKIKNQQLIKLCDIKNKYKMMEERK